METQFKKMRKRGSQACTFCNKRKIRCDGKDPCGECDLRKQGCLYSCKVTKRGPKRGDKWQNKSHKISNDSASYTTQSPIAYEEKDYSSILPSSMISHLVTIFWHTIHPIWPMFARSGIEDLLELSHKEPLLFNAIIVITAKTQAHPAPTQYSNGAILNLTIGQEQLSRLIKQIRKELDDKKLPLRIQSIQIWILMALSELGGGAHDFAFHCSAQASLMTIEMGLHKHNDAAVLSPSQRATFWCVYILDKMLAVMLGKPMLLRKSDISSEFRFIDRQASYPLSPLREGDCHLLIYQEYIKLMMILQDIIEDVYTHSAGVLRSRSSDGLGESYLYSVRVQHGKLQEWKQMLPEWIEQKWQGIRYSGRSHYQQRSGAMSNAFLLQSVTLEAWYHACLLLLHRPLFGLQQQHGRIHYASAQHGHKIVCQSATTITNCLRSYQRINSARCIPSSWIFLTFLSAVIHITCMHDGSKRFLSPHKTCFDDCIALLCEISQTWKHAGRQVENLYVISSQINGKSIAPLHHQQLDRTSETPIIEADSAQKMLLQVDIDTLWNDLLLSFEPGDAVLG